MEEVKESKRLLELTVPRCLLALMLKSKDGGCHHPAITADLSDPGAKINLLLYGISFEEINHSGDGGLYAQTIPRLKTANASAAVRP